MNRRKMIIAAIAIAIMLLGTGYAYWTETLTISNSVSTGYLDVKFIDADAWDYDDSETFLHRSNLVIAHKTIASDGQSISLTVDNLYPGAGASLDFLVENTGSVPAKIGTVTGTVIENPDLADALDYYVDTVKVYTRGSSQSFEIEPIKADTVQDFALQLQKNLKDIILNPGDKLYLYRSQEHPGYDIIMPASITGDEFEDEQLKFNLELTFTQVN
ncbi:hypothetical protein FRZ06_05485 [Anoxybacterium hadale]|uniref:Uncharacterized protein n=1 Tax=Anoxybacterium hadale TaxID=3408580 RepID=A0ACD1A961_9FIRM|nr:hypothetical protein FRZ06_05485 [Clostridiales bacterium]